MTKREKKARQIAATTGKGWHQCLDEADMALKAKADNEKKKRRR